MAKREPKYKREPDNPAPKLGSDPTFYKKQTPVWRFSLFDWEGPWGAHALADKDLRKHFEKHLANLETMTWAEIEAAAGGRAHGNNSHDVATEKLCKAARDRLEERQIETDTIFSLRLEATVRIYGIRSGNCLNLLWFDPHHFEGNDQAAYEWR